MIKFSLKIIKLLCYICIYKLYGLVESQVLDNREIYVAENEDFNLTCQNKTSGTFVHLIWMSDTYNDQGKEYILSYNLYKNEEIRRDYKNRIERVNGTSIKIRNAKPGDTGTYECNIVFQYAKGKARLRMLALYKVHVISPPVNIVIDSQLVRKQLGESVRIFCEAQGLSPFEITWERLDGPITKRVSFTEEGQRHEKYYIKRKYLIVENITNAEKGKYRCKAVNIGGVKTKQSFLKIITIPSIVSDDKSYVKIEKNARLRCQAKGYPTIKFTWEFMYQSEKIELNALEKIGRFEIINAIYDSQEEKGTSVLFIKSTSTEDFQDYTCIASNNFGSSKKDIELVRVGPPDPPKILKDNIKSLPTEIYLFWNFEHNGGFEVSAVTIQYRNHSSPKWTNIRIPRSLTSYKLSDLRPDTEYEFRISASNKEGAGQFSRLFKASTRLNEVIYEGETADVPYEEGTDLAPIIGIFAGAFVAVVAICLSATIFMKKMKKSDNTRYTESHNSNNYMPNQTSEVDGNNPIEMEPLVPPADEWEFPRDRLTITTVLGQGAFGIVMRGLAQGIKGSLGQIHVAVKMVRDSKNDAATQDLLAELNLLKLIPEHPNVVGLLGCCTRQEPYYVIVEYCTYGDLQGFLRSSRGIHERYYLSSYGGAVPDLTSKMLLTFAWQIAKGMAHLAGMKVIHRDLAARNILVDDQLVCKISDFGFARDIYIEEHYLKRSAGGRFPIKWMAIESLLDGISTTKSDVWAFGVVLWELVTLGASPYPGMNSYEVVSFLQDGYRMDKPKHCSDDVYNLMVRCWNGSAGRRPSFTELADICEKLVESSNTTDYISMNYYQDHLYVNFDVNESLPTPQSTLERLKNRSWSSTLASIPQSSSDMSLQEMQCMPPLPPLRTHSSASAHATSNGRIDNIRGGVRPKRGYRNKETELRRTNSESGARAHAISENSSLLSVRE